MRRKFGAENLCRGGFADPEHFNLRRVKPCKRRNPKKDSRSKIVSLFVGRYHPDLNWGVELLQSSALPLGYGTKKGAIDGAPKNGASDEARTRYLHLGKVALYQMSYTRILVPL